MIFDTHAHYDDRQFEEDRAELLGSMQEQWGRDDRGCGFRYCILG